MFQKVQDFGEAFARRAASASELLSDKELRKKASNLVARRAGKRIKNIQYGVQTGADQLGRMGRGLAEGPRQIQAILARLQARVEEQRLQASLQAERDSPVDVQVGHLLCEDAPQELRSRMWMALLDDPSLCGNLLEEKGVEEERAMTGSQRSTRSTSFTSAGSPRAGTSIGSAARQSSAALSRRTSRSGEDDASAAPDTVSTASYPGASRASAAEDAQMKRSSRSAGAASDAGSTDAEERQPRRGGRPAAAASEAGSVGAASLATERGSEAVLGDVEDGPAAGRLGATPEDAAEPDSGTQTSTGTGRADAAGDHDFAGNESGSGSIAPQQGLDSTMHIAQLDQGARTQDAGSSGANRHAEPIKDPLRYSESEHATENRAGTPESGIGASIKPLYLETAAESVNTDGKEPEAEPCTPTYGDVGHLPVARNTPERRASLQSDRGHMTATSSQDGDAEARLEQWEMVVGASRLYDWHESRLRSPTQAALGRTLSSDSQIPDSLRSRIMAAVWNVEWPISTEYAEEGRYNTLLQISIGQEEVDEVITRDIHRTFPEHPQFGFAQGQQALFRVLKAYSLHDLEVSYCQGMAFVAGVVLMYLPEEPAFSVLVRLMGPGRCDLRSLFLPGLEGLKQLLRCFEWLMERLMPRLKAHLEEYCALPVLYASQWFLTCFSCPFPAKFACRVIDVMLQEQQSHVLLRVALAVVAECEPDIMQLDDFEDIITFLKVEPVKWPEERTRKVLNNAILSGLVADEMITCAEQALTDGFEGSLSRRTSVAPDPAAAAEAVVAARQRISEAVARSAGMPSMPEERPSDTGAEDVEETVELLERRSGDVGGNAADRAAMLDPDYMAMVLAMDTLWATDDGVTSDMPHSDDSPVPQSPG